MSRGVEVRGVIAMNGRGELCFFADSRGEGVPIESRGQFSVAALVKAYEAVQASPPRRVSHVELATLDPPPAVIGAAVELLTAAVERVRAAGYRVWGWDDGHIVVASGRGGTQDYRELMIPGDV